MNAELRAALAAAQWRQHQQQQQQQHQQQQQQSHQLQQAAQLGQLSHADILALSRSGFFAGGSGGVFGAGAGMLGGAFGAAGLGGALGQAGGAGAGLASELEHLQRLEEMERRQRLAAAAAADASSRLGGSPAPTTTSSSAATAALASRGTDGIAGGVRGHVIRDERIPGGHIPRPNLDTSSNSKQEVAAPAGGGSAATIGGDETGGASTEAECKEEMEKTPGSVIVPCRARGMPMDHNFKTAYFVIPENVKHGEELICSYFACRNAGIKFRYCSHCKVPVAKRNFRKRHKHGGDVAVGGDDDSGGDEESTLKRGIPSQITAKTGVHSDVLSEDSNDIKEDSHETLVPSPNPSATVKNEEPPEESPKNEAEEEEAKEEETEEDETVEEQKIKITKDRRERWAALLELRPTKDGDSMKEWVKEVMAVSDLDTPLKPEDDVDQSKPRASDGLVTVALAAAMAANSKKPAAVPTVAMATPTPPGEDVNRTGVTNSNHPAVATASNNGDLGGTATAEPRSSATACPAVAAAGVVKKRPATLEATAAAAAGGAPTDNSSEAFAKGSFAAWKERKRQKKQAKMAPTQAEEV